MRKLLGFLAVSFGLVPGVVQNRITGVRSALIRVNPFLLLFVDMQREAPERDFLMFWPTFPIFYRRLVTTGGRWAALKAMSRIEKGGVA